MSSFGSCRIAVLVVSLGLVLAGAALGQQAPAEIGAEDFPRTRDITKQINEGKTVFAFPKYKLKGTVPKPKPKKPASASGSSAKAAKPSAKAPETWEQIGVTLWRCESTPAGKPSDRETARLLNQKTGKEYAPVRVAGDTVFAKGDKVRLSIESPRDGYLYIFDRELHADGGLGEPYQIFPTRAARGGDNRVRRGMVVDIPAQTDEVPCFELDPVDPNWRGEMLTVIVSPQPLTELEMPSNPSKIPAPWLETMEDKYLSETSIHEQDGTAGKSYTAAEKTAAADATRQLTQKDPYPQTIYRVKTRATDPMAINLKLAVDQ